jgi:hypothetical protein
MGAANVLVPEASRYAAIATYSEKLYLVKMAISYVSQPRPQDDYRKLVILTNFLFKFY